MTPTARVAALTVGGRGLLPGQDTRTWASRRSPQGPGRPMARHGTGWDVAPSPSDPRRAPSTGRPVPHSRRSGGHDSPACTRLSSGGDVSLHLADHVQVYAGMHEKHGEGQGPGIARPRRFRPMCCRRRSTPSTRGEVTASVRCSLSWASPSAPPSPDSRTGGEGRARPWRAPCGAHAPTPARQRACGPPCSLARHLRDWPKACAFDEASGDRTRLRHPKNVWIAVDL